MLTFRFQEDPTSEILKNLAAETDWPCVWCETYLRSSAPSGSKVVAFTVENDNRIAAVALATRTPSLRNRQLMFPSYPRWIESGPDVAETFWQGLEAYLDKLHIAQVLLNSYEAPAPQDVPFSDSARIHERQEYYVDLDQDLDVLFNSFSSNHRRNVRKGERQDFTCEIGSSDDAFERHLSVFSHTQARRAARDESPAGINESLCRDLLASGDGFLMQLRLADETVSSFLILLTPTRAFYYSGGTTAQGMRMGASHYLMWLVIKELKQKGARSLSLGGISGADPAGLARYKLGFGTTVVSLANMDYRTGKGFAEGAFQAARRIKNLPAAGLGALRQIVRLNRWVLFSWGPGSVQAAAVPSGQEVRPLGPDDFEAMRESSGRLASQADLYFYQRGITTAYGLFAEGKLVHISWVYRAADYARSPVEQIRLGAKEAEITNCFTLEDHRGQGLYATAIRSISHRLFEQGVERVYMKTTPDNTASQRGIVKAGLRPDGTVYHVFAPALSAWKGWYYTKSR